MKEILVLYGSQTGNSEAAAKQIANQISDKLIDGDGLCPYVGNAMQLDDFLEYQQCAWSSIVVIVTSSYGVGQAPLGCYRFREFCDEINEQKLTGMLKGVKYAMLGLGDSKYTTFFQNPTKIDQALTLAGAERFGALGKADASGEQMEVIEQWIRDLWPQLQGQVDALGTLNENEHDIEQQLLKLKQVKEKSWDLCLKLFPHYAPTDSKSNHSPLMLMAIFILIVALTMMLIQQNE